MSPNERAIKDPSGVSATAIVPLVAPGNHSRRVSGKRYQIFISSTFEDLKEEREAVAQAIQQMGHSPIGMEQFPAVDMGQFEYIKSVIDESDYYVLIVGGRYGSISPDGQSFTEKEFDYAVSKGLMVTTLLHKDPKSLPAKLYEQTDKGRENFDRFRSRVHVNRLVAYWETKDELAAKARVSLDKHIELHPGIGWVRADAISPVPLGTAPVINSDHFVPNKIKSSVDQVVSMFNLDINIDMKIDGMDARRTLGLYTILKEIIEEGHFKHYNFRKFIIKICGVSDDVVQEINFFELHSAMKTSGIFDLAIFENEHHSEFKLNIKGLSFCKKFFG